tara:strand:- start:764 stop:3067 length:2304 start_codon:yes stop_codon:yes gene_type:complete
MKREIQLYISNVKVDLFKDETVSLTDSIKNVRDIAKVFTTFTKSFTLPASPTNNKLFQHYYNFDIINGYDGRIKRDARIEINHTPYKTGKIKLEGVELKSELPHTYRVTFFGNTVDLKDIFKEDKLKDLSFVEVKDSGTTTSAATNKLIDSSGTFTNATTGVSEGDRVYNNTAGSLAYATITSVDSATQLTLDADIMASGDTYQVLLSPFWNSTAVLAKLPLQSATTKNSLITPLITAGRRPIYDASISANTDTAVNLEYDASENKGLEYTDLKFALRVHEVIKAIENTYTTPSYPTAIDFTTDFFSTSNANYHNLFLWLSRKSGEVSTTTGAGVYQFFVSGFTGGVSPIGIDSTESGFLAIDTGIDLSGTITAFQIVITPQGTNSNNFTVTLSRNGSDELTVTSSTPTSTVTLNPTISTGFYRVLISSDGEVKITSVVFTVSGSFNYEDAYGNFSTQTYSGTTATSGAFQTPAISTFDVADQMPDIKVIDFVSGLFKMFNLVAFVNSSGKIEVRTLDNSDSASFYHTNNTTEYDITEYVDIETKQVDVALPYKEIELKYQGLETFLADNHNQLFNEEWGSLNYNENTNSYRLSGSTYKIELPFAHFKYERFGTTAIQVGWSANKDQNEFLSKPLLFYPLRKASTTAVSFKGASSPTQETTYNIPSNSRYSSTSSGEDNINFGAMINEYAAVSFSGTLFENYYKNYITNIFNTKNRLTKIKAILPLSILLNYELNDIFIIKGKKYRINSITTNLTTGEANIELLNVL